MFKKAFCRIIISFIITTNCLSQGGSAFHFLRISPHAEANGMAEASVALSTNDPVAVVTNPHILVCRVKKIISHPATIIVTGFLGLVFQTSGIEHLHSMRA